MQRRKELKLARAYVPYQPYVRLFPLPEALMKGTIFPNLYQPYIEPKQAYKPY
ncbi:MAG: spore coat associated protein CotJA [Peptococcaceae bacterium]